MASLNTSELRQIFESLDQNGDGFVSLDELNWLLEKTGVHATSEDLVSLVGQDGLDFDEFSYFYESILRKNNKDKVPNGNVIYEEGGKWGDGEEVEEEEEEEDSELYRAFKVFDLNGDGFISPQELQNVLWRLGMWDKNGVLDCDRIISKYDVNSDGFVDFEEFKRMMLTQF